MSIAPVSSIPSTVVIFTPVTPVAAVAPVKSGPAGAEKVRAMPPPGVGENLDIEA